MKRMIFRWWPVFFIFVVWFIFASPYFFKGKVPFPSRYLVTFFPPWNATYGMPVKNNAMPDVITQLFPWKKLTIDSWKLGQVPGWNPYQFAGTPLLANSQSAVFTPFNLLFWLLPFVDGWSLLVLLQPILAGLLMYLFLRGHASQVGALPGAISFMFCGFITVWMAYGTLGYAALFLPLLLYGLDLWQRQPSKLAASLVVISVMLSVFAGHIQTSVYVIIVGLAYILFKYIQTKKIKLLLTSLLLLVLGLTLSLPQLIPTANFYRQSVRSQLFEKVEAIPWNYLVTILAPDFFGNPVTRNDWFGHYAEWAGFSGIVPLLLAGYALFSRRKKALIYFFGGVALLALLLSYATPLSDLLVKLRLPLVSTSSLSRIILLFSFSIAVLSAVGYDSLASSGKGLPGKRIVIYCLVWLIITLLIWWLLLTGNLIGVAAVSTEKLVVAKRNFILPSGLIFLTLAIFFAGLFRKSSLVKVSGFLLLILVAFDMLRFATKWMPFEERQYIYPDLPVLGYLQKETGFERVFGNFGNEAQSVSGLLGIEGYDPLYIRRYAEFVSAAADGQVKGLARSTVIVDKQGRYTKKWLDLLGVKYLLHRKGDGRNVWAFPYWRYPDSFGPPVYSDEHFEVYINTKALPRSYLVANYLVARTDQEILSALTRDDLDLRRTVVLEEAPPELIGEGEKSPLREKVSISSYTPSEVVIEVETDQAGLLFLSDSYYPGWQAEVNGQKTKIYRADYAFRAVVVPAGKSTVRFVYENWFL